LSLSNFFTCFHRGKQIDSERSTRSTHLDQTLVGTWGSSLESPRLHGLGGGGRAATEDTRQDPASNQTEMLGEVIAVKRLSLGGREAGFASPKSFLVAGFFFFGSASRRKVVPIGTRHRTIERLVDRRRYCLDGLYSCAATNAILVLDQIWTSAFIRKGKWESADTQHEIDLLALPIGRLAI
jgi:hypothetical protein